MPDTEIQRCQLCNRKTDLTFHHLIPKKNHAKPWFKRNFSRAEMNQRGVMLCRICHRFIHRQFDEQMLGKQFNTLSALQADQSVQTHVAWAKKQRVAS